MNKNNKYFWISWVSVLCLCLFAFILLRLGYIDYGVSLFCVLPVCIGILTGVMPRKVTAILGTALALAAFILILWAGNLEGAVCILMAIPVIAFFVLIGYVVAFIIKKLTKKNDELKLSILPLVLFLVSTSIEFFWQGSQKYGQVTTSVELPFPDSVIFNHIKKVDTVVATPTYLHRCGLPYPRKCVLTAEKIGGLRICKFDEGTITETITGLRKNELLEMEVTSYDMPGKNWFSFEKDIYKIKKNSTSIIVSRTTTYLSKLKPRLYWEWVEKITIGAEQELVFENLKDEIALSSY